MNSLDFSLRKDLDIYYYDYANARPLLKKITNTPELNETSPAAIDTTFISYITDENDHLSRNTARLDSIFSFIRVKVEYKDTARFHPDSFYFYENSKSAIKLSPLQLKDTAVFSMDTAFVYRDTAYNYRLTNYSRNIYDYNIYQDEVPIQDIC